jgi:hypothetical protein
MRVIATQAGFYNGFRQRVGSEFEYAESDMAKNKGGALPKWVVPASPAEKVRLANAAEVEKRRQVEAVIATAGPKRAGSAGVREVSTGLADATAEPPAAKAPQYVYPGMEGVEVSPKPPVELVPAETPSLF